MTSTAVWRGIPARVVKSGVKSTTTRGITSTARLLKTISNTAGKKETEKGEKKIDDAATPSNAEVKSGKEKKKTMAELDEELRAKLEGRSGEGGAAGLELEDGKPVAMKRGVKQNMFRLI